MNPYYDNDGVTIYHGDCLEVMRGLPAGSVDAVVTDPPYGLSFMGRQWDYDVPAVDVWREALRVLKPGGHLIAFGGSRTYHRLTVNVEDAGFEIRDQVIWMYGSGFPKSLDVSKAIDKEAGCLRGTDYKAHGSNAVYSNGKGKAAGVDRTPGAYLSDPPTTDAAKQWDGWGTALKPAHEPAVLARKPFAGTVAQNVQEYGTGAVNVGACRVDAGQGDEPLRWAHGRGMGYHGAENHGRCKAMTSPGRWPANIIHDGSPEVLGVFPETASGQPVGVRAATGLHGRLKETGTEVSGFGDSGSAARFFYCAKASPAERGPGNNHPTVKPIALMRYLCRLVTPPGGVVLDPFAGSGTTGIAARLEGFRAVLCEREADYLPIITARLGCEYIEKEAGGAELRPPQKDQLSLFSDAA